MYEDLIKKLRNRRVCVQSGGDLETDFPIMREAADAIEDLEFACNRYEKDYKALCAYLPKWIPVTERLPEDGEYVLAYSAPDDLMFVAARHRFEDWEITHWMPLPKPPKEATE